MRKFFEKLNDFLYDSVDYLVILGIIGLVVFIIGWRLDLLFADNIKDLASKNKSPDIIISNDSKKEPASEESNDSIAGEDLDEEGVNKPAGDSNSQKTLTINIPPGSSSSNIGDILESKGLISSKSDFINKTEEMNVSNNLKAGNYEIQSGSSLETILKTLTK